MRFAAFRMNYFESRGKRAESGGGGEEYVHRSRKIGEMFLFPGRGGTLFGNVFVRQKNLVNFYGEKKVFAV